MKKGLIAVLLACAVTTGAHAAEVQLGAGFMYDWWSPVFAHLQSGKADKFPAFEMDYDHDGSFMLGPTLQVDKISGGWGLKLQPLIGVTRNQFTFTSFNLDANFWEYWFNNRLFNTYFTKGDSKARRYDVDLGINKDLNKYLLLLIGVRFNYADAEGTRFMFWDRNNWVNFGKDEFSLWTLGPSLGLGFKYEIKDFSFGLNASFLVCAAVHDLEKRNLFPLFWPYVFPYNYKATLLGFGFDTNVWLAYFIQKARISLNVGFRWVGTFYAALDDSPSKLDFSHDRGWAGGRADHFYGITFGAAYRF